METKTFVEELVDHILSEIDDRGFAAEEKGQAIGLRPALIKIVEAHLETAWEQAKEVAMDTIQQEVS